MKTTNPRKVATRTLPVEDEISAQKAVITTKRPAVSERSPEDIENALALIEKGHQLAGHFPSAEALDRARRVLDGTTTATEARAELAAKYGLPRSQIRPQHHRDTLASAGVSSFSKVL